MKNNIIYFKKVENNDSMIRFIANGTMIDFSTERDKNIKYEARKFIVDGLNHLLEWAYINNKSVFLSKFTIFILMLKNNLTSSEFLNKVEDRLKSSYGKDESDFIKGELYADIFARIDRDILYTILEYVQANLVFNSNQIQKTNKLNEEIPSLGDLDIFILCIIVTISKLITLGGILLGKKGKMFAYTTNAIITCVNTISYSVIGEYLYNTGQMDNYNTIVDLDLHDNIYLYLRDIILGLMDKNTPTTELLEENGKSRQNLIKEVIDSTVSAIYKILPIDLSKESGVGYSTGDDIENFKFTSRSIMNYTKKIIKINHDYKNVKVKHKNVVKVKRIMQGLGGGNSILIHKQELRVEKKDSKDLIRRKEHIKILSKYVRKYLERHNISSETQTIKTDLSDYFVIKLLNEISEDFITMKLMNLQLYNSITLMIAHRLEVDYLPISLALLSTSVVNKKMILGSLDEYQSRFNELNLYNVDPERFIREFTKITSYDYNYVADNGNAMIINIKDAFLKFIKDDQDSPFVFIEGYLYDEEENG